MSVCIKEREDFCVCLYKRTWRFLCLSVYKNVEISVSVCTQEHEDTCVRIKEREDFCVCLYTRTWRFLCLYTRKWRCLYTRTWRFLCLCVQGHEDIRDCIQEMKIPVSVCIQELEDFCVYLYIKTWRFLCLSVYKKVRVLCLVCFIFHKLIRYISHVKRPTNTLGFSDVICCIAVTEIFQPLMWSSQSGESKNTHGVRMYLNRSSVLKIV